MPSRGPSGRMSAEDPALLRLELLLREDPASAQIREPLELRSCRVGRPRCASRHHPLLIQLALVVDRLLDLLGLADVIEPLPAGLRRGLDHERAGPDDPIDDALLETNVV